ncbi:CHRD domain-containing protein [Microcoleus sp. FACHB-1515]|uniref:CHRD domain-containing protein n=1 Tax=Cyanophyceae TaxID=3028117 RepID=UPI0018EFFD4B|nr:CHRD domain-containing protein [Microcoleus sp. FACHB-1515]
MPQSKSVSAAKPSQMAQPFLHSQSIDQQLMAELREAETVIAQGVPASSIRRYVAVLTKDNVVVPATPSTGAFSAAGAVLVGDRLIVRGDFSNLTSALRDFATDPVDPPNPNITSGIHIHQGDPTINGPFQYALEVSPNVNQTSGRFRGEFTLTSEQLQALSNGNLYVDIHTQRNRAGEMRGSFQPY